MPIRGRSFVVEAGVVAALLFLAGCAGGCRRVQPDGPEPLLPLEHTAAPTLSSLTLPVEIPTDELNGLLDEVVPWQLYHTENHPIRKGLARARLNLTVRRRGRVHVETKEGLLITHLPLEAEGHVRVLGGIKRPFSTTFTIHAVTDLSLDSTWATQARTRSAFTWREKPTIGLIGFRIDVSGLAGNALEHQLAKLAPRIDTIIEERVDLRWRIERLWENLAEPVAVRDEPPVWLTVEPVDAYFVPGISQGDTLVFGLGVQAYVGTVVGDAPPTPRLGPLPTLRALPDSIAAATAHAFTVHVPVSLSYDDANALLTETLGAEDFLLNDQFVVAIQDVKLYGRRDSLVARVDFKTQLQGSSLQTHARVFLIGVPTLEPESQTLRIEGFTYDVRSELALAETADWFLRDDFLTLARERLVLPLADRIETARTLLDEALTQRTLGRHILLNGQVEALSPGDLYLTPDGIALDLFAHGTLTAHVHTLDEIRRAPARPELP